MTLTKAHLIESISNCTGMSKDQSKQTIESLFEILKEDLANGEDVLISGFGKFCIKRKNERRGRNPAMSEAGRAKKVVPNRASSGSAIDPTCH